MGEYCSKCCKGPITLEPSHLIITQSGMCIEQTFQNSETRSLILPIGNHFPPKQFVFAYLTYFFFISNYKSKQVVFRDYFLKLARSQTLSPQQPKQKEIFKKFTQEYKNQSNEQNKYKYILSSVFQLKFILDSIDDVLLHFSNPNNVLHILFPMADIFNGIKTTYRRNKIPKLKKLYIVAALQKKEQDYIAQIAQNQCCFCFSTFVKGFTVENYARKYFLKNPPIGCKNFFFTVNFPFKTQKLQPKFDYGYYINSNEKTKVEGDVLFNILNSFKVVSSSSDSEYDLQYGYLPYLYYAKYTDRSTSYDQSSLEVIDVCEAVLQNCLKSQSCLLRILKFPELSMKISKNLILHFKGQPNLNKTVEVDAQVQLQNIANIHIDRRQFDKAEKEIVNSSSFLLRAKKLEILYKRKDFDKAREMLIEFNPLRKSQQHLTQAQQKVEFIRAKLLLEEGRKEKAKQVLKGLHQRMRQKYKTSYEVIGMPVISAYEKLNGLPQKQKVSSSLQKTIKSTQINLQGISTNIDSE